MKFFCRGGVTPVGVEDRRAHGGSWRAAEPTVARMYRRGDGVTLG